MAIQTSTTVGFNENTGGKRLVLESDSSPGLAKRSGTSYVRVFPSVAGPVVTPVMGKITRTATFIPFEVTDYVSFSGSASSGLQYPPSSAVVIADAKFFNANPSVAYNADTNSLTLSESAHGICKVTYTAQFDRYTVDHGDAPCKAAITQTIGMNTPAAVAATPKSYDPAFLVAEAVGFETASLEIDGPPCVNDSMGISKEYSGYDMVGLKIEVDSLMQPAMYPYYFSANNLASGFTLQPQIVTVAGQQHILYCGCRVRVYPAVSVTLTGVNCGVSSTSVGRGVKQVRESLTFSGTQNQNLQYPPSGLVSLAGTSASGLTVFGGQASVSFVGPGGWVNEVTWETPTKFEVTQGARKVRDDEVVAVTTLGSNTLPIYSYCECDYTTDYFLFDVLFTWDQTLNWYGSAMILAQDVNGKLGHITIEPPAKGGNL